MKKFLSIFLCLTLVFAFSAVAFAEGGIEADATEAFKGELVTLALKIVEIIATAIVSFVALKVKALYQKHVNTDEKRAVADDVVRFVDNTYKNLHGEEKLNTALSRAAEILTEKGIPVTMDELRVIIEAAHRKMKFEEEKNT